MANETWKLKNKTMEKKVYWHSNVPMLDDFGAIIGKEFIDGKTNNGRWAIMSERSYRQFGIGLGLGKGQRYEKQVDGRWLKTGG